MKLIDLSPHHRQVLIAMGRRALHKRREIADHTELTAQQVSSALNRLEASGFIDGPVVPGGDWCITDKGIRLLAAAAIQVDIQALEATKPMPTEPDSDLEDVLEDVPEDVPAPVEQAAPTDAENPPINATEPTVATEPDADDAEIQWPDFVQKDAPQEGSDAPAELETALIDAMEIELALDRVRSLLRAPRIPSHSARVYREVVAVLPSVLREALAPITALVGLENAVTNVVSASQDCVTAGYPRVPA